MSKPAVSWTIEFVSLTLMALLLSTARASAKWWVVVPVALIIANKAFEQHHYSKVRASVVRYQLQILVALLPDGGAEVRCTYHRPLHRRLMNRTKLVQAFDYIPDGRGAGRAFPTDKGIIGKVYCVKEPLVENFASDEEYRRRMVLEYNYTASEVMQRRADRRSYLCYPIIDENHKVLGLLYFDSDKPGTFTLDEANPGWQAIRAAGKVICSNVLASS